MSTDRAALSEQRRPASRGERQSAIASEPMIRRRCAIPTIAPARSAMARVVVASKARISSSSFGSWPSSAAPSRKAPAPRVAVHSSRAPKS